VQVVVWDPARGRAIVWLSVVSLGDVPEGNRTLTRVALGMPPHESVAPGKG